MWIGQEFKILGLDWALIHFIENPGMAFGIHPGKDWGENGAVIGKLALSLFRILAVGFLIYYIRLLIRAVAPKGLLISFALILAGALGNIIDSAFYGLIFSASDIYHGGVATFMPEEGGYAGFLFGKVVDMLYFPMFQGTFPEWFPIWAGEPFLFFKPVFNIADSAITIGVLNILLFQRSFFKTKPFEEETEAVEATNPQDEFTTNTLENGTERQEEAPKSKDAPDSIENESNSDDKSDQFPVG